MSFPGIDSRPDVCGGEPRIVGTRIPVWLLEQARRLGASERELLEAYASRRAADLVDAPMRTSTRLKLEIKFATTKLLSGPVLRRQPPPFFATASEAD